MSPAAGAMGIKFHCPNGHKLNVKAFLAGKKGVCPKCGTKFRIPAESEPGLVDSDLEEGDAGASGIKSGNGAPATQPQPALAAASSSKKASPLAAPASGASDPIAEGPQLAWYVRPPTGGQFGPARGDIMRTWLGEGRVTSDSLVWREGWTDWQTAGNVFPSLNSSPMQQPAAPAPLAGLSTSVTPQMASLAARPADKKGTSGMAVAILVGLGLVCLVLVAVLAFVLTTVQ